MIECRGVFKTYPHVSGERLVLKGVDFSVAKGASAALLGESGSGKTTLMHILGLLDHMDQGSLVLSGRDVSAIDQKARALVRRSQIGFVFQHFHLMPRLTVLENVILPLNYHAMAKDEARQKAALVLSDMGLGDVLDARPNQLSGGMQQRVAIARAMVHRPLLLLADEPTGALDPLTGERVLDQMFERVKDYGTTLIVVTHNPAVAKRCDQQWMLDDGLLREG